jgi:tetratricopeptide (TPR) repeat protein
MASIRLAGAALKWSALAAALPALGCAATQQQVAEQNVRKVRAESTVAQLEAKGDAAAGGGDMVRAEQYFAAALRAGGDERYLTARLLVVCSSDGRYPAAQSYGEDYVRRHPNDTEIRYALATLYIARGDLADARLALEQVVAEKPDMPDPHYALATVLRDEGDSALDVDREFREYIRLEPNGKFSETVRASLLKSVP